MGENRSRALAQATGLVGLVMEAAFASAAPAAPGWLVLPGRIGDPSRRDGRGSSMASRGPQERASTSSSRLERGPGADIGDFAELFASHREDLGHLCRRMLDDSASVEDALSEIFMRAHRALPTYDAERPFKPWLRTLAANHCIDQLRRRKTERRLFPASESEAELAADDSPGALRTITRREEQSEVLAALDALPDKYRIPLVLRFYRELDYDGIAAILGVSRGQVGTLLFRAKKRLRVELLARREGGSTPGEGPADE